MLPPGQVDCCAQVCGDPRHAPLPACCCAELTSQQTHSLFKEFVNAWNGGALPLRFYTGLAAAPLKRTSHQWGFKGGKAGAAAGAAAAAAGGGGRTGMAAYLADQQEQ